MCIRVRPASCPRPQDLTDLLWDVELIWANCRTYNDKGSPVHRLGTQARQRWLAEAREAGIDAGTLAAVAAAALAAPPGGWAPKAAMGAVALGAMAGG